MPPGQAFNFQSYMNHLIRVRGWVEKNNGPSMALTHPQQIEILDIQQ